MPTITEENNFPVPMITEDIVDTPVPTITGDDSFPVQTVMENVVDGAVPMVTEGGFGILRASSNELGNFPAPTLTEDGTVPTLVASAHVRVDVDATTSTKSMSTYTQQCLARHLSSIAPLFFFSKKKKHQFLTEAAAHGWYLRPTRPAVVR